MEPKITVGMTFGTFSATIANLRERFVEVQGKNENIRKFFVHSESYKYYKPTGESNQDGSPVLEEKPSATASKRVSLFEVNDSTVEKRCKIRANVDGFVYSNKGNLVKNNDKFTVIETDTQIARDLNGNGIVDKGEISNK